MMHCILVYSFIKELIKVKLFFRVQIRRQIFLIVHLVCKLVRQKGESVVEDLTPTIQGLKHAAREALNPLFDTKIRKREITRT